MNSRRISCYSDIDLRTHKLHRKSGIELQSSFGKTPFLQTSPPLFISSDRWASIKQLPFQQFNLLRECGVGMQQVLNLAHRMQHRGVVAPAELPADFGE